MSERSDDLRDCLTAYDCRGRLPDLAAWMAPDLLKQVTIWEESPREFGRSSMELPFRDRRDAGRQLAAKVSAYAREPRALVLALPRGGVPVAYEVARALHAPLDLFLVRKLGVPGQEELALGAIATGGVRVLNDEVVASLDLSDAEIAAAVAREERELARRERAYRGDRPAPDARDRVVILVDDGLATGATMRAAVRALRRQGPARLVVGVPIAAPETCAAFRTEVDDIVCAATPVPFHAVGLWYEDFAQTTDDEVRELLALARRELGDGTLAGMHDSSPPPSG